MSPVSVVLNFHKLARVALKVIVGALESDPRTRDIQPPAPANAETPSIFLIHIKATALQ